MGTEVEIWWWSHRWFTPLRTEELRVRVSPRGEIVGFERIVEETRAARGIDPDARVPAALAFLRRAGPDDEREPEQERAVERAADADRHREHSAQHPHDGRPPHRPQATTTATHWPTAPAPRRTADRR